MPNDNLTPHARRLPDNSHLSGDFHDSDWINWPPPQTRRNAPPPPMWFGRPKSERRPCPYVYEITNWVTGHFYIGYRCHNVRLNLHYSQDLLVKYFTSSKYAKDIKRRRIEWVVINVWEFDTAHEALAFEEQLLDERGAVKNPLYLNKGNAGKAWNTAGLNTPKTAEHRRKIGNAHRGKSVTGQALVNIQEGCKKNIGRKASDETRAKQSRAAKGKKHSAEHVRKVADKVREHHRTPEYRAAASERTRKALQEKPEARKIISDKKKAMWKDENRRAAACKSMSKSAKKRCSDAEYRKAFKERMSGSDVREKAKKSQQIRKQDPVYRARVSESVKQLWACPKYRKNAVEKIKQACINTQPCPHCNRVISTKSNYMRWHGDNCKHKASGAAQLPLMYG